MFHLLHSCKFFFFFFLDQRQIVCGSLKKSVLHLLSKNNMDSFSFLITDIIFVLLFMLMLSLYAQTAYGKFSQRKFFYTKVEKILLPFINCEKDRLLSL